MFSHRSYRLSLQFSFFLVRSMIGVEMRSGARSWRVMDGGLQLGRRVAVPRQAPIEGCFLSVGYFFGMKGRAGMHLVCTSHSQSFSSAARGTGRGHPASRS